MSNSNGQQRLTKQKKNVGRSIEETMVRRKVGRIDGTNPNSWPEPKGILNSNSLPVLRNSEVLQLLPPPSTGKNFLADYQQDDQQKMLDTLMNYCRALQAKVEDLEYQLLTAQNKNQNQLLSRSSDFGARSNTAEFYNQNRVYTGALASDDFDDGYTSNKNNSRSIRIQSHTSGNGLSPIAANRKPVGSAKQNTRENLNSANGTSTHQMSLIIGDIDHKVMNLKELFRKGDPLDERRVAATKIGSIIRGFLSRQRHRHFQQSLVEFKWTRCRMVVFLLDILLSNQSKLDAGFHLLKMNRNMKTLHVVFDKWAVVCRQNAPIRRGVKLAALEKIEGKRIQLMRSVFNGLRSVSIGAQSTKHANAVRRKLIEGIRSELSLKLRKEGLPGVVPESEITKVLHRRVVLSFWERKNAILTRFVFGAIQAVYRKGKKNMQTAIGHKFKVLAGKCFFAWSNFVYLVSMGLDRKRWPAPRKYEVRYNQKRVDNYARMRCTRMVYVAWKKYFMVQYKVKHMYRAKVAQLMLAVFTGWKTESRYQHRLRASTMDNWKGYARLMVYNPFHAWANHVKAVKNHHNEQIRICKSYVRWKWRQRMLTIIKVWRHQALYGRIDGLYSRQMLLKTLGEQKILVNSVEKLMGQQTIELEECKSIVSTEINKRKDLETNLSISTADNTKLKMTNHHYEQELRRLESVIESMASINPKQVAFLKTMQPKFKFKERNISVPVKYGDDASLGPLDDLGIPSEAPPTQTTATTTTVVEATPTASAPSNASTVKTLQSADNDKKIAPATLSSSNSVMSVISEANRDEESVTDSQSSRMGESSHDHDDDNMSAVSALSGVSAALQNTSSGAISTTIQQAKKDENGAVAVTSATLNGPPLTGTTALAAVPEGDTPVLHSGPQISDEDMLLLTRVKWLLARYNDEVKHAEMAAHTQPSLNLLQPAEDADDYGDQMDEPNPFPIGSRPPLLPVQYQQQQSHPPVSGTPVRTNFRSSASSSPSRQRSFFNTTNANAAALSVGKSFNYNGSFSGMGANSYSLRSSADFTNMYNQNNDSSDQASYQDDEVSRPGERVDPMGQRILLSFIDFLDFGDVSAFALEDRRDWIRTLLEKSYQHESLTNAFSALTGEFPLEADRALEDVEDGYHLTTLDNEMNGAKSWRDALMQFRAFSTTNVSNSVVQLTDNNVNETDVAIFSRILQMRDTSESIIKKQTAKFRDKLHQKLSSQYGVNASNGMMVVTDEPAPTTGSDTAGDALRRLEASRAHVSDILGHNIYASNLRNLKLETNEKNKPISPRDDMSSIGNTTL